jgi:hypothetical protein
VINTEQWSKLTRQGPLHVQTMHGACGQIMPVSRFILAALSAFDLVAPGAGIHAWTGGAVGTMTLAVMSRATLGHTGQQLEASHAADLRCGGYRCPRAGLRRAGNGPRRCSVGSCRHRLGRGVSRICCGLFGGVLVTAAALRSI